MTEWSTVTVGSCLERLNLGKVHKVLTRDYKPSGQYPIVDQGQDPIAGWTDDDSGLISTILPVVIFGDHTRVFKYVDFPFVRGADGTQLLKPKAGIDPLFFYYACKAVDLPSRGYNRHFKTLKEKEIQTPTLNEQRNIAAALQKIDTAFAHQGEQLGAVSDSKRAAMRMLFTCGLRDEALKETKIGLMPESWDVVNFSAIRDRLQYGTSVKCTYELSEYPVLRIPNIESDRINSTDIKYCLLSDAEAAKFRLEIGELIFIRTNGVLRRLGACAVYTGEPANALFASYLIRAQLKSDRVNPHFAAYYFGSEMGTHIITGRATPASDGKYNLNTGIIDSLPLPLPSTLDEQNEIVAILQAIDRKIELHQKKRAVLDDLFKALLHKLMIGEIQVADVDLLVLAHTTPESLIVTMDATETDRGFA